MKYSYAVVSDKACDLTPELRARFEVDGHFKGYMSTPTQDDVEASIDMSEEELDKFYAHLKANKTGYKTAATSVAEIAEFFEGFLQKGLDILALSVSSGLSVTYNLMLNAQKEMSEKYPERKIIVVDTTKVAIAFGMLVIRACEARAEGKTIEQTVELLEKIKSTVHQSGTLDDLFWAASKGRISNAKAVFGTVLGIKTLADFDSNGMVTVLGKVSGFAKAYRLTVEYIKKTIKDADKQIIFVAHTNRKKQAEILVQLIKEKIKPKEVILTYTYPLCGINIGPGLMAAYYFGTEITDLQREKEIVNDIISKL